MLSLAFFTYIVLFLFCFLFTLCCLERFCCVQSAVIIIYYSVKCFFVMPFCIKFGGFRTSDIVLSINSILLHIIIVMVKLAYKLIHWFSGVTVQTASISI